MTGDTENLIAAVIDDAEESQDDVVQAAQKAADALTVRGHHVRVAELPNGADPNGMLTT